MYDKSTKTAIIRELVANVFNKPQQNDSVLDGQIIADYITEMGRSHESSNEQCIFGRVALPRHNENAAVDHHQLAGSEVDGAAKNTAAAATSGSNFVYTGATLRTLE